MPDLKAITVYLPPEEVEALNREAEDEGRSGASAQIRWLLAKRRKEIAKRRKEILGG